MRALVDTTKCNWPDSSSKSAALGWPPALPGDWVFFGLENSPEQRLRKPGVQWTASLLGDPLVTECAFTVQEELTCLLGERDL